MDVQRGAVVDQPRPAVPHEQVRVLRRSGRGWSRGRRARRRRPRTSGRSTLARVAAAGLNASAPGRKSIPRFSPPLAPTRSWISSSGSASPSAGSTSIADEVGHGQADRPAELAGQPLGDERARALAGAAELDDVQPVVVGLDEAGQRAALAQGRHVARGDRRSASCAQSVAESTGPCDSHRIASVRVRARCARRPCRPRTRSHALAAEPDYASTNDRL